MHSLIKLDVVLSFPLGAVFDGDPIMLLYKNFLRMLKRLNCVNIDSKCIDCELKKDCQYHRITGDNFSGYPGIVFRKDIFERYLFKEREEMHLTVYIIGDNDRYASYLEIFFKEYLNYKIGGQVFQIKTYQSEVIEEKCTKASSIRVRTLIEEENFSCSYNRQAEYYNKAYGTHYEMIGDAASSNIKRTSLEVVSFGTRKIKPVGFVMKTDTAITVSDHLMMVGVGKYNYAGGGICEIEDQTEG